MISRMLMSLSDDVLENLRRDARLVRHVQQRDLRNLLVARDADDFCLFHLAGSFANPRPLFQVKARADVDGNVVGHADLGRARMQHLRAARRHLDRVLVAELRPEPRVGHDVRIGRQHAVDVGADLAHRRIQRRGHRRAGDVAAAAAERRHLVVRGDALEAGDDDDLALAELLDDARGVDRLDAGAVERAVRADVALRAGQRDRRHALCPAARAPGSRPPPARPTPAAGRNRGRADSSTPACASATS